jgi:hypothetical protein
VGIWDELRVVLARLRDQEPSPLTRYPSLDSDEGGPPPFTVGLASWATGAAGELHRQFGDQIDLTVGALPYPPGTSPRPRPGSPPRSPADEPPDLLDPDEVTAALDGPAVVRSGATLDHGLLLTNHTTRELQVMTNGRVTATVVDPGTGERVGGFSRPQTLPGIRFRVGPGQTERIPLLIGTDSFDPRLGYTVPAGQWGIQTTLTFSSGDPGSAGPGPGRRRRRTPILPLTITT